MTDFKIGQRVVCIDDCFNRDPKEVLLGVKYPIKDKMYTVRHVKTSGAIRLQEILNPVLFYSDEVTELAFKSHRFRAVDELFAEEVIKMICEQTEPVNP